MHVNHMDVVMNFFISRTTMTVAVLNLGKTAATPRINGQGRQTKY